MGSRPNTPVLHYSTTPIFSEDHLLRPRLLHGYFLIQLGRAELRGGFYCATF